MSIRVQAPDDRHPYLIRIAGFGLTKPLPFATDACDRIHGADHSASDVRHRDSREEPCDRPHDHNQASTLRIAAHSDADNRSLTSLIEEYLTVRRAMLSFFESLPEEALTRIGIANGNPMSVRAAAFHTAGHELHHLDSIRTDYLA